MNLMRARNWPSKAAAVEPNPVVGAVLVRDDKIVGEGWHAKFGRPMLRSMHWPKQGTTRGATLYVTLEPCCHQGQNAAHAPMR